MSGRDALIRSQVVFCCDYGIVLNHGLLSRARYAGFELVIRAENSRSEMFFIDLVRPKVELNHDSCIFWGGGGGGVGHWRYLATKSTYFDMLFYLVNY